MNINPSDGHNLGWGEWPVDGQDIGSEADSCGLTGDFVDSVAWAMAINYITIVCDDNVEVFVSDTEMDEQVIEAPKRRNTRKQKD